VLILIVFVLLLVLGVANANGHADSVDLFGRRFDYVPVALVMLYSFAFGALCIGIFTLVSEIQLRTRLFRQRKEMDALMDELRALRNAPLETGEAKPAATEGGEQ
jgi:uncharacterized integral membrane protein